MFGIGDEKLMLIFEAFYAKHLYLTSFNIPGQIISITKSEPLAAFNCMTKNPVRVAIEGYSERNPVIR